MSVIHRHPQNCAPLISQVGLNPLELIDIDSHRVLQSEEVKIRTSAVKESIMHSIPSPERESTGLLMGKVAPLQAMHIDSVL